ncbi:MAG: hypothetical protein E6743_07055 [Enterobacter hormaechei]|nr:hypothetical protein [Enterobacter sp.]MDU1924245.1 hypothetical protein [Enterobacter sp.]MDU1999356.1 hypothetical protein [Enterobacter hormaechei]
MTGMRRLRALPGQAS